MVGARGMWLIAREHGDRFLLRRYYRPTIYKIAEWLVENGYARWIPYSSNFAPGIELTSKPWQ